MPADIQVKGISWQRVFAKDPEFHTTIKTVYIVDVLRTLLRARYDARTLTFVEETDVGEDSSLLDFLLEAAIVVLSRSGRQSTAMEILEDRLLDVNRRANRPILLFRRAECFLLLHDESRATALLNKLALAFHDPSITLGMSKLSLLLQLARLMTEVDQAEAIALSQIGLQSATHIRDVVFQVEFLSLIRKYGSAESSLNAQERIEQIRREALYGAANHPLLAEAGELRVIDGLFQELINTSHQPLKQASTDDMCEEMSVLRSPGSFHRD